MAGFAGPDAAVLTEQAGLVTGLIILLTIFLHRWLKRMAAPQAWICETTHTHLFELNATKHLSNIRCVKLYLVLLCEGHHNL